MFTSQDPADKPLREVRETIATMRDPPSSNAMANHSGLPLAKEPQSHQRDRGLRSPQRPALGEQGSLGVDKALAALIDITDIKAS